MVEIARESGRAARRAAAPPEPAAAWSPWRCLLPESSLCSAGDAVAAADGCGGCLPDASDADRAADAAVEDRFRFWGEMFSSPAAGGGEEKGA